MLSLSKLHLQYSTATLVSVCTDAGEDHGDAQKAAAVHQLPVPHPGTGLFRSLPRRGPTRCGLQD